MQTSQNPLRRKPVTPVEYGRLFTAAQYKAAWLLKDHRAALDAEMAAERAELEAREAKLTAETSALVARTKRLTSRRSKLMAIVRENLTENAELEFLGTRARGVKTQLADVKLAVAALESELADAREDARRTRDKLLRVERTTAARKADIEGRLGMSEGGRRLLEAADEVDDLRRRKATAKAEAVKAPKTA